MPRPPHTLEHEGKILEARAFDNGKKKEWARWVYRRYREIALEERQDGTLTEDEYQGQLDQLRRLHFAGEFGFLAERGAAAACTPDGALQLVSMIFGIDEDAALALMVARKSEVEGLVKLVLQESFPEAPADQKQDDDAKKKLRAVLSQGYIPPPRPPRGSEPGTPSSSITSG